LVGLDIIKLITIVYLTQIIRQDAFFFV